MKGMMNTRGEDGNVEFSFPGHKMTMELLIRAPCDQKFTSQLGKATSALLGGRYPPWLADSQPALPPPRGCTGEIRPPTPAKGYTRAVLRGRDFFFFVKDRLLRTGPDLEF